jgi:hypothetical protein
MIYPEGTWVQVTEIKEKDYLWEDGQFEELSSLVNGKKGILLKHFPESKEFGERESYLATIQTLKGPQQIELELDEFILFKG